MVILLSLLIGTTRIAGVHHHKWCGSHWLYCCLLWALGSTRGALLEWAPHWAGCRTRLHYMPLLEKYWILQKWEATMQSDHLASVAIPMGQPGSSWQTCKKNSQSPRGRTGNGWILYSFNVDCNVMLLPSRKKPKVSFLLFNSIDNANLLIHLNFI